MLNLKSLEITCKQCKTKITLDIGKTVIVCPLCNNAFYNSYDEAPFKTLRQSLKSFEDKSSVLKFEFITDEKE
ncbi:hypothetical protein ACSVV9_001371 [Campylobacter coli]|nr:hypothetical protein [Campylobacter coli]EAI4884781.1 hypothetical protein [Campylobacter coli]EAJ3742322.1 hypothetical protein [Campylobacter coli]EAJ9496035.1 hypothetical protein [Campylobacter coli]EAL4273838.1 hypothetical protein [Campylobacter coli]